MQIVTVEISKTSGCDDDGSERMNQLAWRKKRKKKVIWNFYEFQLFWAYLQATNLEFQVCFQKRKRNERKKKLFKD